MPSPPRQKGRSRRLTRKGSPHIVTLLLVLTGTLKVIATAHHVRIPTSATIVGGSTRGRSVRQKGSTSYPAKAMTDPLMYDLPIRSISVSTSNAYILSMCNFSNH